MLLALSLPRFTHFPPPPQKKAIKMGFYFSSVSGYFRLWSKQDQKKTNGFLSYKSSAFIMSSDFPLHKTFSLLSQCTVGAVTAFPKLPKSVFVLRRSVQFKLQFSNAHLIYI